MMPLLYLMQKWYEPPPEDKQLERELTFDLQSGKSLDDVVKKYRKEELWPQVWRTYCKHIEPICRNPISYEDFVQKAKSLNFFRQFYRCVASMKEGVPLEMYVPEPDGTFLTELRRSMADGWNEARREIIEKRSMNKD